MSQIKPCLNVDASAGLSASYASVVGVEILVVLLTAGLSFTLKSDPTRSFVLSLLFPVSGLVLSDSLTILNFLKFNNNLIFMITIACQIVFNNCVVLTFLFGTVVFLGTSAHVVRTKAVPTTWPAYVVIVFFSSMVSVADYFSDSLRGVPSYVNQATMLAGVAAIIIAALLAPFYARIRAPEGLVNTTDQAVFNAKWRLFWLYLYLIVPSLRCFLVIATVIDRFARETWLSYDKSPQWAGVAAFIDLAGALLIMIPVYFCLPAYRSALFFCYKSREINPIFFFTRVMPKKKKKPLAVKITQRIAPTTHSEPAAQMELISLENAQENGRSRRYAASSSDKPLEQGHSSENGSGDSGVNQGTNKSSTLGRRDPRTSMSSSPDSFSNAHSRAILKKNIPLPPIGQSAFYPLRRLSIEHIGRPNILPPLCEVNPSNEI